MNPYFEQMILNASPTELIRLLYQRSLRAIRDARRHLAEGQIAERSACITHAYAIVEELMSSLQPEAAPELAARLRALYCYVQERLVEANLQQTDPPLAEALGLMTTLSEAWQEPAKTVERPRAAAWMTADVIVPERVAFSA